MRTASVSSLWSAPPVRTGPAEVEQTPQPFEGERIIPKPVKDGDWLKAWVGDRIEEGHWLLVNMEKTVRFFGAPWIWPFLSDDPRRPRQERPEFIRSRHGSHCSRASG